MSYTPLALEFKEKYLRPLCDKSSSKRKAVADEILVAARACKQQEDLQTIEDFMDILLKECLSSINVSMKKGGLIGVAALVVATDGQDKQLLRMCIPPILDCFDNCDNRIRFYAAESLLNIIKASRENCLEYFEDIFDGICTLCTDVDSDIKNSVNIINNSLKENVIQSESFDINRFKHILKIHKSYQSPYVRKLVLSWVRELSHKNDYDFVPILPCFLEGLFDMLTDRNVEVKREADALLNLFLQDIIARNAEGVDMDSLMKILLSKVHSEDNFVRFNCVTWIHGFIQLGTHWNLPFPELIRCLYLLLSDREKEIIDLVDGCYSLLLNNLEKTHNPVNYEDLAPVICEGLVSNVPKTIRVSLKTLRIIILKGHQDYCKNKKIKDSLLTALKHPDDKVVADAVKVLVILTNNGIDLNFFLPDILDSFYSNSTFLETRGSLIIRTLCKNLSPEAVYTITAQTLLGYTDYNIASLIIHMLTIILLTAQETTGLRVLLRSSCSKEFDQTKENISKGKQIFLNIYPTWCINPISALALCWLVEDYQLAYNIIILLGKEEFSLSLLMQADKLVQILESPVYLHLRLHLVNPSYPSLKPLLQSLFGFLMIFPQSEAYKTLQSRLSSVLPLHLALNKYETDSIILDENLNSMIKIYKDKQNKRIQSTNLN